MNMLNPAWRIYFICDSGSLGANVFKVAHALIFIFHLHVPSWMSNGLWRMCALMACMNTANIQVPPISVENEIRCITWTHATTFTKKRRPAQQNNFSAYHYRPVKSCWNVIKYIFRRIFPVNIDLTVTFKVYDGECWCWSVMIFNRNINAVLYHCINHKSCVE